MPPKKKTKANLAESDHLHHDQTGSTKNPGRNLRKEVKLAHDADLVLSKCRALRNEMRKPQHHAEIPTEATSYSPDLSAGQSDRTKILASNLASLKGASIIEVSEMNSTQVLEGIESIAMAITTQVMQRQGFTMETPSRASSNQIYVSELDRIVLGDKKGYRTFLNVKESRKAAITTRVLQLLHSVLLKRIHITKRDLFYTDVKLFVDQAESDGVLDDVATMVGCTRSNLHVVASDKGLVVGRIQFTEDGDEIDCTKMGVGGKAIPPYIDKIENIR